MYRLHYDTNATSEDNCLYRQQGSLLGFTTKLESGTGPRHLWDGEKVERRLSLFLQAPSVSHIFPLFILIHINYLNKY